MIEVDNTCLVLVEGQAPGRQPLSQARFDLFGLRLGRAQGDQIVGIADQHRRARYRITGMSAVELVTDPGGLFHPMQRDVQQNGTDHPTLGEFPPQLG